MRNNLYLPIEIIKIVLYNDNMKIFRAIGEDEQHSLREKNDIFYEHNTCKREDWILYPHPEDYKTGKFFFFTMEDAILFAKEVYLNKNDHITILKMDINEEFILPYLCCGIYDYPDYTISGMWDNMCGHAIAELLLPFSLIGDKVKNAEYKLIDFDKSIFHWYDKNDKYKFSMPYQKDRPIAFVEMGNLLSKINGQKKMIAYYQKDLDKYRSTYFKNELEKEKEKLKKIESTFPQTFAEFISCMRNYVWNDFRADKTKDYIDSTGSTTQEQNEKGN